MEDRDKKKKILYIVLGVIAIILLFFMIRSCGSSNSVKDNPNAITNIELASNSITLTVGDEEKLSYTILPDNSDETTRWTTDNSNIVSVDARGNIKALNTGVAVITLVSEGGVADYVTVKVVSKLNEDGTYVTASLVEKDINLKVGSTKKLSYELDPIDSKYIEVLWESGNQLVATVTSDGVVTGVKSGVTSVVVKIVLSDNTIITDTATVTVEDNASLYLTTTVPDVRVGEIIRLSAALSATDVTMTEGSVKSSNENVASISNVSTDSGYLMFDVKGLKAGTSTLKLTAITSDGKTVTHDVPVTVVKFTDLYISSGNKEIKVGNSFILSGRLEPSIDGSLDTECKSSNEKVVTVSNVDPSGEYNGSCQITGIKTGSATVTMTISGQKNSIKVTVSEDGGTDSEGSDGSGDSGDSDGSTDPENPVTPSVEPSLTVTLDKEKYSINDTAVITVTFTDESGNTKTLTESEYTVATEFDSSSLGTKKLVVVYPYNDSSLKAETSYTISGGSSSGVSSGLAGSGGYSGGGGGGSSSGGVKTSTGTFKVLDCSGSECDGSMKVNYKVQGTDDYADNDKYLNTIIVFECKDPDGCEGKAVPDAKALTASGKWTDQDASKYWSVVSATVVDNNTDFTVTSTKDNVTMTATALPVDKDKIEKIMNDNGIKIGDTVYYGQNGDLYRELVDASTYDGVVLSGSSITFDQTIINTNYGNNADGVGAGTITFSFSKVYKSSPSEVIDITATATANAGYRVTEILANGTSIKSAGNVSTLQATYSTDKNQVQFTAMIVNASTGDKSSITATATIPTDTTVPTCIAKADTSNKKITVVAREADGILKGVERIGNNEELIGNCSVNGNGKIITCTYSYKNPGLHTFKVTNESGLENTCTATSQSYCYAYSRCNNTSDSNGQLTENSCTGCVEAGCEDPNKFLGAAYKCERVEPITGAFQQGNKTNVMYIYKQLDEADYTLELVPTTTGINASTDTPVKYNLDNIREEITLGIFDFDADDAYKCTLYSDKPKVCMSSDIRFSYSESGISENSILQSSSFKAEFDINFKKNCAICGCDKWTDWTDYKLFNDSNPPGAEINSTNLSVLRLVETFSNDCSNIDDSLTTSTFICNSLANGVTIGSVTVDNCINSGKSNK